MVELFLVPHDLQGIQRDEFLMSYGEKEKSTGLFQILMELAGLSRKRVEGVINNFYEDISTSSC